MFVTDLIGSMQESVGYWLVDTFGFCSPGRFNSRSRLDPDDPALSYLEPFVLKQIVLRILQFAAGGPLRRECGDSSGDKSMGLVFLDLRIVGMDASDEVRENILRFVDERDHGSVMVRGFLEDQVLHTIPFGHQPFKEAILVCFAVEFKAVEDAFVQWFAYVVFAELVLDWLGRDQIGGALGIPVFFFRR